MRKFIFFFMLFSICSCAIAQVDEQSKRFLLLSDFSGGRASHYSEFVTPNNKAQEAQNVRVDGELGSLSKRNPLREYGDTGGTSINGIHRFYKSDNTAKLIVATGTTLQVGEDTAGTFSSIQTGLTDGARWDFETYKDNAIMVSQSDSTYKYDGHTSTGITDGDRTANYLCAELGAPYADIDTGTDLSPSSWYQYKVLFKNGTTDIIYYSRAESNKIYTGTSDYNIALSDIPLGKEGITERQIYRTAAQTSAANLDTATFKLVGTIADNSTQIYADAIADASLGIDWSTTDALNITPLTGSIVHIQNERLFIAGNSDDPSYLFWSDERNPDWFDRQDFYPIRPDDGDRITFLETILGNMVVGKTNTIQFFYTDGTDTAWSPSDPFSANIGCPAQYSAQETPFGIIFLGRFGLYLFNGSQALLISDEVTDIIRDIKQSNIDEVFGLFWYNKYLLSYTSDSSGSGTNNRVLIYDLKRKSFVTDTKNINCMTVLDSGNDFGSLYYGSSDDGYVTSEGSDEKVLIMRYKSDFDAGTYDDVDSFGTEESPYLEIAWTLSIDGVAGTSYDLTIDGFADVFPNAIIDRPDTYGEWLSPVYKVSAKTLNKLFWNEELNSSGDVTARIRTALTESGITSATWSSNVTTPSGSDLSSFTSNDYLQLSFSLSTSDILFSPRLELDNDYVFKLSYSLEDSFNESSVASEWRSGWYGIQGYMYTIKRIRVFYEADTGTLSVDLSNIDGDKQIQFDIDLSQEAPYTDSLGGEYIGYENNKIYSYYPGDIPLGEFWRLKIYDNQLSTWIVKRVEVMYEVEELRI